MKGQKSCEGQCKLTSGSTVGWKKILKTIKTDIEMIDWKLRSTDSWKSDKWEEKRSHREERLFYKEIIEDKIREKRLETKSWTLLYAEQFQ